MLDIVVTKWMKDQTGSALRKLVEFGGTDDLDRRDFSLGPLRIEDMIALYRAIRLALPDRPHAIIEVTSASSGEGVSSVVRGVAQAAASVAGARVLVCDATPDLANFRQFRVAPPSPTLNDCVAGRAGLDEALKEVPSRGLALCALSKPEAVNRLAVSTAAVDAALADLRERYDLVIIDTPPANRSVLGPALARKVDGVVVVVEAERTRAPIVAAALHAIKVNSGRVIGVVLNKRRMHIPGFIYRWL